MIECPRNHLRSDIIKLRRPTLIDLSCKLKQTNFEESNIWNVLIDFHSMKPKISLHHTNAIKTLHKHFKHHVLFFDYCSSLSEDVIKENF